jgi:hypothetical protein
MQEDWHRTREKQELEHWMRVKRQEDWHRTREVQELKHWMRVKGQGDWHGTREEQDGSPRTETGLAACCHGPGEGRQVR